MAGAPSDKDPRVKHEDDERKNYPFTATVSYSAGRVISSTS
jgi:hypothetical protein